MKYTRNLLKSFLFLMKLSPKKVEQSQRNDNGLMLYVNPNNPFFCFSYIYTKFIIVSLCISHHMNRKLENEKLMIVFSSPKIG